MLKWRATAHIAQPTLHLDPAPSGTFRLESRSAQEAGPRPRGPAASLEVQDVPAGRIVSGHEGAELEDISVVGAHGRQPVLAAEVLHRLPQPRLENKLPSSKTGPEIPSVESLGGA